MADTPRIRITAPDRLIEEPENNVRLAPLLDAAGSDLLSVTYVEIDGRHAPLRTDRSDRAYYVVDGPLRFLFENAEARDAQTGSLVLIGQGEGYALEGRGRYLVINGPAFREGDDVWLDGAGWAES